MQHKKSIMVVTIILFILLGAIISFADEADTIQVIVNGEKIQFDVPPCIEKSRTLVPVRAIFEALGASMQWDGATHTVKATKGSAQISLQIGNDAADVNGEEILLDMPAKIIKSRTFVPVRFVSEALGAHVFWEEKTKTIYISKGFYGNTMSNLMNDGMILTDNDNIHYIALSSGIVKYNTDLSEGVKVTGDVADGLNKVGDYLFFMNNKGINRLNIETDKIEQLHAYKGLFQGSNLTVYNNWIYYIGSGDGIYRIRPDGTEHSMISGWGANDFFIYQDKVYFGNGSDQCKVYRMNLDGSNLEKICDIKGSYSLSGAVHDGWIFFTAEPEFTDHLYRMRPDGSELELVIEDVSYFNIDFEKITYIRQEFEFDDDYNTKEHYSINTIKFDKSNNQELYAGDGYAFDINYVNEDSFYFSILGTSDNLDIKEGRYYYDFSEDEIDFIDTRPELPW